MTGMVRRLPAFHTTNTPSLCSTDSSRDYPPRSLPTHTIRCIRNVSFASQRNVIVPSTSDWPIQPSRDWIIIACYYIHTYFSSLYSPGLVAPPWLAMYHLVWAGFTVTHTPLRTLLLPIFSALRFVEPLTYILSLVARCSLVLPIG